MKKFFKEFKEFISRGNIVDLAVAVIIGGAFSAIVTAFTNKIIMPFVNLALSGGSSLDSAYTILKGVYDEEHNLILESSIYIDWGAFITAVINFLIIALTLFVIVKVMNSSAKKLQQLKGGIIAQTDKELIAEKKAVKAQAEKDGKSFKEAWAEHLKQKELEAEEEKKRKEAEEAEQKAKERAENPTQEDLLKEIRDLLKSQNKND